MNMQARDFVKPGKGRSIKITAEGVKIAKEQIAQEGGVYAFNEEHGIPVNTLYKIMKGHCMHRTWVKFFNCISSNLQPAA